MTWNTIRKATEEDHNRLEKSAKSFLIRTGAEVLPTDDLVRDAEFWVECCKDRFDWGKRQERNWKRIVKRALQHPRAEGIERGYVGYGSKD